ncbi:MAG TPA: YaiI/YqxD family protein [Agitococcus sp.]|nr:YaiI/YqxD family protein [Agitococcus sp.]
MQIWVDADACPVVVKEILFKAAERLHIKTTLVANQFVRVPASQVIRSVQVPAGFDVADNWIVEQAQIGDLVITADVPLAAAAVAKGAFALNPRGEFYTPDTIANRLTMRNLMTELRETGQVQSFTAGYSAKDKTAFANQLDRFLTKHKNRVS